MATVNAKAAAAAAEDERTVDQRRADALVELACHVLQSESLPDAHRLRPTVRVTVALSTLLGLDEQPGELDGVGPIPAGVARRIAADPSGTWRRLICDPRDGRLLEYGSSVYRPPEDLAQFVIARDQVCIFPTCQRPAEHCDLEHRVPYEQGGPTSPGNLAPLCRRHHLGKHHAGWQVSALEDGSYRWTLATGHQYASRPPPRPIGQLSEPDPPGDPPPGDDPDDDPPF